MNRLALVPLLVLIFMKFLTVITSAGWEPQVSGTSQNLNGVSFASASTGTAVGNDGTIVHTTDVGANWSSQAAGLSAALLDVSFYDDFTGTAVGQEGTIIYTTDGGTWNTAQTGWMISYFGTQMLTSSVAFAVGVNTIFQPLVEKTTNGWSSWNSYIFYLDGNEGRLNDVHFIDNTLGFAAARSWTGQGVMIKSINGGQNWSTVYWTANSLNGLDFPSVTVGYAVGNNGTIVKSTDGGNNWALLSSGVGNNLADVSFPSALIGTAVGSGGLIIRTTDGGATWYAQTSGTSVYLNEVEFPSVDTGYVVGNSGTILFTSNGGDEGGPEIPTLSEWGMIILALLLLLAGTIAVVRRRRAALSRSA